MHGNCKCGHHVCAKILVGLAWLSAIAFWWASWNGTIVWNFDSSDWFAQAIVFVLLAFSTKFCGCCWKNMKIAGGMNCACTCGNCEGGKCGGTHNEGHRHQ